jgi:hypothetical protein
MDNTDFVQKYYTREFNDPAARIRERRNGNTALYQMITGRPTTS